MTSATLPRKKANGLRKTEQRVALGRLIETYNVKVCVVTETNLKRRDLRLIDIAGFVVKTHYCRAVKSKVGGVLSNWTTTNLRLLTKRKIQHWAMGAETCFIDLSPTKSKETSIRAVGVYIPGRVARKLTLETPAELPQRTTEMQEDDERTSAILAGDFNPPEWSRSFDEWLQTYGIWELGKPSTPTYSTGSSLDKMLFTPCRYTPSTSMQTGWMEEMGLRESGGDEYYPGTVYPQFMMGDHAPVLPPIPCDMPATLSSERRLILGDIDPEKWEGLHEELDELLNRHLDLADSIIELCNIAHVYNAIEAQIKAVFPKYIQATKKKEDKETPEDNFRLFL